MKKLKPEDLIHKCTEKMKFKTTDDLPVCDEFIAQDRAIDSIKFGIDVGYKGYNIFVSGQDGTGKASTVRTLLEDTAKKRKTPNDWCYLHNFDCPENPIALALPPGRGRQLKKSMEEMVTSLLREIPQAFESKDYEEKLNDMIKEFSNKKNHFYKQLEGIAKEHGFELKVTKTNVITIPLVDGKALSDKEYEKLEKEKRDEIEKERETVNKDIVSFLRKIRETDKKMQKMLESLQKEIASDVVNQCMEDVQEQFKDQKTVLNYLEECRKHILDHLTMFATAEQPSQQKRTGRRQKDFVEYLVNVIVDNTNTKGAPIIFEKNPTFFNIFGKLEKRVEYGFYIADFTMIMAGSLLKANGGFLIINALDTLISFKVWENLKRFIKNQEITIEDPLEGQGIVATTGFKPMPIPLNVKVVMIGTPYFYNLLYHHDDEFKNIFKVKADFDYEMPRNNEFTQKYASFIATRCREHGFKHFTADGVAAIIEYSSRLVDDKIKLSSQFGKINDLIVESTYWAKKLKKDHVDRKVILKAIEEKEKRCNLPQEKVKEYILDDILMIETSGKQVGQVNGLTVLDVGDHIFGRPAKITAQTFRGEGSIVNIEREVKLSGSIHNKGVLILSGYLGAKYAKVKKMGLSASICFEQSYGQIDGDSASSTELYAILSSISKIPIKQSIAVTGSINQKGEIQPIGGVNAKIEGFFDICKKRGLSGDHGVIIPEQNVRNLMLKDEVFEAVKNKKFNIYSIANVDEGLEILTGSKAGKMIKEGVYEKNSIHDKVSKLFDELTKKDKKEKKKNA